MFDSKPYVSMMTASENDTRGTFSTGKNIGREGLLSPDSSVDSTHSDGAYLCDRENTAPNKGTFLRQQYLFDHKNELSFSELLHYAPGNISQFYRHGNSNINSRCEFENRSQTNIYNYVNLDIPFSSYLANLVNTFSRNKTDHHLSNRKAKVKKETGEEGDDVNRSIECDEDLENIAATTKSNIGNDSLKKVVGYCVDETDALLRRTQNWIPTYLHQYQVNSSRNLSIHPIFLQLPEVGPRQLVAGRSSTDRKYECDICGKYFSRSNTLITHKRIHSGDKPFQCEVCGRSFRQPGNLTRHRLIHTSIKPYVCVICKKAFNRASNLTTHMRTHSDAVGYTCPHCGKLIHNDLDVQSHKCLKNDRCHKCDVCGRSFGLASILNAHRRVHHRKLRQVTVPDSMGGLSK
ncbi:hypothetical protein ScPMuIL_008998 [Solemya velum]